MPWKWRPGRLGRLSPPPCKSQAWKFREISLASAQSVPVVAAFMKVMLTLDRYRDSTVRIGRGSEGKIRQRKDGPALHRPIPVQVMRMQSHPGGEPGRETRTAFNVGALGKPVVLGSNALPAFHRSRRLRGVCLRFFAHIHPAVGFARDRRP